VGASKWSSTGLIAGGESDIHNTLWWWCGGRGTGRGTFAFTARDNYWSWNPSINALSATWPKNDSSCGSGCDGPRGGGGGVPITGRILSAKTDTVLGVPRRFSESTTRPIHGGGGGEGGERGGGERCRYIKGLTMLTQMQALKGDQDIV
jgi:hypothetical protein